MRCCEHCGSLLALDDGDHLTVMQRRIFECIAAGKGDWISTTAIIDHLYGDRQRTAQDHFDRINSLTTHVARMNARAGRKIIEGDRGAGKRGYRLATGADGVIS